MCQAQDLVLAKSPVNAINECPQVFGIREALREETTTVSLFMHSINIAEHSLIDRCCDGHKRYLGS